MLIEFDIQEQYPNFVEVDKYGYFKIELPEERAAKLRKFLEKFHKYNEIMEAFDNNKTKENLEKIFTFIDEL